MGLDACGRTWKRKSWMSDDHIEITGLLRVFLRSPSWPYSLNIHLSALMPILLFFSCLLDPPPSPLPFFIFFPPHLHSFLSAIPSYTLCPLTLNHRWTKQWTVSHSIKTNNPVTGGWLCGAGAAVTRHYARWVQAATNLRQRWFNSQMDI